MLGDFGFQHGPVGNVRRIRDQQVYGAVEFGQQGRVGDVSGHHLNLGVGRIAPGVGQGGGVVVHRQDPGARQRGGKCDGQGAGSGTQVKNEGGRRKILSQSPFQDSFGLRARNEHSRAHVKLRRAESRATGDVLKRDPLRTGRDSRVEAGEKARLGRLQEGQSAAFGAGHMRGQKFGIGSRGVDSGPRQCVGGLSDRGAHGVVHACCSRACLSAATSASSSGSRSPSSTWSRL